MISAVAISKRAAAQELAHTLRPPTFGGLAVPEQIRDRRFTADEHQLLAEQLGFKDIA